MLHPLRLVLAVVTALSCAEAAVAQQQPQLPDPKACAPGERLNPGERAPIAPETTGQNPSDKLARTGGVLCPPNVDPKMSEQPPNAGALRVIPPPGSPGGDPSVQPK